MKNKKNIVYGIALITTMVVVSLWAMGKTAKAQTKQTTPVLNFYGNVDAGVQSYNNGTETLTRAGDGGLSTSRLGFRGSSPDLGGIQFKFNLEGGLRPNTGTLGSTTTTGQVFTREAWVGVNGSAGEIRLGTTDASAAVGTDDLGQFNNFTNYPVNRAAIEIGNDVSNAIRYLSPVFNGVQLQAGYAGNSASATTDAKSDVTSGSVTYVAGAAKLGVGYATKKATTAVGETDAKSIGGSYDFGKFAVGAGYIYGDNSTTETVKSTASVYSVKVPLKNGIAAHAVYATAKDGAQTTANEGTGYTVGLSKTFAPGANVYAAYTKVDNDANSTMFMNGMGAAPSAGKDPSLVTIGINYAF